MIKVKQMISDRSYNPVANQFIIEDKNARYFQSYDSVIVKVNYKTGKTYLDRNTWDYSTTTGKYRNQFLGEGIAQTRAKIKAGEYKLTDLNK